MKDEMRVIEEAPNYCVSRDGKVYSLITEKEIKPRTVNSYNSQMVRLRVDGKEINRYVHRLVAAAYIPPSNNPKENQVVHLDGDKKNNTVINLIRVTQRDIHDGYIPQVKLNPQKVRQIRKYFLQGDSQQSIAKKFGVCARTIKDVKDRTTWKHV